ncbi:MAG: hypothetical protein IJ782_03315, partial [Prevotella sp.]|nr:hypothetical protein [Prevotella sp.]
ESKVDVQSYVLLSFIYPLASLVSDYTSMYDYLGAKIQIIFENEKNGYRKNQIRFATSALFRNFAI